MAGAPADNGPLPKRSEERRRRNKTTDSGESNEVDKVYVDPDDLDDISEVDAPEPNDSWHEIALMQYNALRRSAMRVFYEPTDWTMAYLLCDQISRHLHPQPLMGPEGPVMERYTNDEGDEDERPAMRVIPMSGSTLTGFVKALANLGMMEGDRRRLRIEVERSKGGAEPGRPTAANVIDIRSARLEG